MDKRRDKKDGPTGSLLFRVAALDKREEALDLAMRIGAAAGFQSYRIVRSDTRRVEIDWSSRKIAAGGASIPMGSVRALELRGVKIHHNPSDSAAYWNYHCEVWLHHVEAARGEPASTMLLDTEVERDDPATPWRGALPLVTDLARAMGVERRVTNYVVPAGKGRRHRRL